MPKNDSYPQPIGVGKLQLLTSQSCSFCKSLAIVYIITQVIDTVEEATLSPKGALAYLRVVEVPAQLRLVVAGHEAS